MNVREKYLTACSWRWKNYERAESLQQSACRHSFNVEDLNLQQNRHDNPKYYVSSIVYFVLALTGSSRCHEVSWWTDHCWYLSVNLPPSFVLVTLPWPGEVPCTRWGRSKRKQVSAWTTAQVATQPGRWPLPPQKLTASPNTPWAISLLTIIQPTRNVINSCLE